MRQWHGSLKVEAKRYEIMVEVEVGKVKVEMEKEAGKVKAKMDNEIAQYHMKIEIGEIKLQAIKKNYQTMLVCL